MPLNKQGYTPNGRYFGIGAPLYFFAVEYADKYDEGHLRAWSRVDAMAEVKAAMGVKS